MLNFTWILKKNESSKYFDKDKNFYICSYGGSGSMMLFGYLANFGTCYHIHSRNLPDNLRYIDTTNKIQHYTYEDNWNNCKPVEEDKIKNYKVIYIYRDPIKSMYSVARRFPFHAHMLSIQCPVTSKTVMKSSNKRCLKFKQVNFTINDFKKSKVDICGLEEFFDNYTQKRAKNYFIFCIKYETFFENIESFNKTIEIEDVKELYPIKKEHSVFYEFYDILRSNQYRNLFAKINTLPPIYII